MEQITYRKTLDVHKNGVQFMLQGFQTADNLSRVIEISLMASGDAIDFPLEQVEAMMYVTTPNATEPSINKCTIKDNKVVYDVLPIVEEGITTMQLKILTTSPDGARGVLASPEFAVEVAKSSADDGGVIQTTTFTALEDAMAKAKATYDERFLRMELTSDCIFKAYYADGTVYETGLLKKLFYNGNVQLSESYAHGGTGVRAGEDTDNSMYYSNVSRSEALNAKNIMENSEEILENVKLHGMYTAFSVDFESGEVEYVSPSFKFNIDPETGQLDAKGQTYTFNEEIARMVEEWLATNGVVLSDLQRISGTHTQTIYGLQNTMITHAEWIAALQTTTATHTQNIVKLQDKEEKSRTRIDTLTPLHSYLSLVGNVNEDMVNAALGKNNEDNVVGVGKALAMYARYKDSSIVINDKFPNLVTSNTLNDVKEEAAVEIINDATLNSLLYVNNYMYGKVVCDNAKNIVCSEKGNVIPSIAFAGSLSGTVVANNSDSRIFLSPYGIISDNDKLIKSVGTIQTNGAKYLNFVITDGKYAGRIGVLNANGTELSKFCEISNNNVVVPGTYSVDVSNLTEVRIGILFNAIWNGCSIQITEVILSDFEMK